MPEARILKMLKADEGWRNKPYLDTVGKWTIGYGRNLTDTGISLKEGDSMLRTDLNEARAQAAGFDWFTGLDLVRQDVVVMMIFNLGLATFKTFARTINSIAAHRFDIAATEMLNSKWATQVGARAQRLAFMMRTGVYPK